MNDETFFPARPETRPMIYAYEEDNPKYAGMLKVGFASTGVFMLRNLKSPETYFQTAFRVQSPWVIDGEIGREIVKRECPWLWSRFFAFCCRCRHCLLLVGLVGCALVIVQGTKRADEQITSIVNFFGRE